MAGEKRAFPYYSSVPDINLKRRGIDGVNPGREVQTAEPFELPDLEPTEAHASTDFGEWTDAQIKGFLDQRGEDHDDCRTREQLVKRALQCEYTTGPAQKPPATEATEADDPLDAFMAEMQQMVDEQEAQPSKAGRAELEEEEDHVADFLEARRQNGGGVYVAEGYNSDEEVYATDRAMQQINPEAEEPQEKQQIGPLPALDHDSISYEPFAKDFYTPASKIAAMTPAQVNAVRRQLGIRVSGFDAPAPVTTFEECGLGAPMMAAIKAAKYQSPTGIQAQALPAALSGRDVLGIAKTGSGKTAAFLIPMFVHIQDQPELEKGAGPIGVVAAPTRELAEQIHKEARKFGKPYGMRIAAGIGGLSKYEQFKDLKAGADAMICTPGRLIDLIKMKGCSLRKTTFVVFDEADRMFDMGFEPQVRSIIGQIRPDRQTLLFSATMPNKVERLVRDALTSPVRVTVGEVGAANEDITQVVEIVQESAKLDWLVQKLPAMIDNGEVLVFANMIARVEEIAVRIQSIGHRAVAIHGDMSQHSRAEALREFSSGRQHVLVATDIAARGLDIKSIKNVVNMDAAKDIDTHIHRVGRTGRAGDKEGTAYTLLTPKQSHFAGLLVNSMAAANQEISAELQGLAMKESRFRKGQTRSKGGSIASSGGKRRQLVGGAGIGFGSTSNHEDPMKDLYGDRAEFTRGSNLTASQGPNPPTAPPPGPPPQLSNPVLGRSIVQPRNEEAPTVSITPRPPQEAAVPQPEQEELPGSKGVFGGRGFSSVMQTKFKSQFVASGTAGGDINEKPTIIAPKASKPQEASAVPSYLAKKMNPQPSQDSAQQAIAAALAIAARLSGGASQSSGQTQPPAGPAQNSFPPPVMHGRAPAARPALPAGFGSSASAYPDLSASSSNRSDRPLPAGREERDSRSYDGSSYEHRGSGRSNYGDRDRSHGRHSGRGQGGPAAMGSSASAYPDLSGRRDRSRGSEFSEGFANSASPAPATAAQASPLPFSPAVPSQVLPSAPPGTYSNSQLGSQPHSQQGSGGQGGGNIQASIAAARAIAARLSAQAAQAAPNGDNGPRLGGVSSSQPPNVVDSVQASIEAAKAIAARMGGSGNLNVLGSSQSNVTSGQWAWGRG